MGFFYLIIIVTGFLTGFMVLKEGKNVYFGVRLPLGFTITDELKALKKKFLIRYVLLQICMILCFVVIGFIDQMYGASFGVIYIFAAIFSGMLLFAINNKEVKAIKKRDNWTGYTEDIVVVDLDYRKAENLKLAPKWLMIIPGILVTLNLLVSIFAYFKYAANDSIFTALMPSVVGVFAMLVLVFARKSLIKSKPSINGGNIDDIKVANIKSRYYASYIPVIGSMLISVLMIVVSMSYYIQISNTFFMIVFIVSMLLIAGISYKIMRNITKAYKDVKNVGSVINRDDDKYYKWGLFYYNPRDPAKTIKDRTGMGTELNYGNKVSQIITILGALAITGLIGYMTIIVPIQVKNMVIAYDNDSIKVSCMYSIDEKFEDIKEVRLIDKFEPKSVTRTNGASLGTVQLGYYNVDGQRVKLLLADTEDKVIEMKMKDGRVLMFNLRDGNGTIDAYEKLRSKVG